MVVMQHQVNDFFWCVLTPLSAIFQLYHGDIKWKNKTSSEKNSAMLLLWYIYSGFMRLHPRCGRRLMGENLFNINTIDFSVYLDCLSSGEYSAEVIPCNTSYWL